MKAGMPAYMRRACGFLAWLEAEKGDAQVAWRGKQLGTWNEIRPRWSLAGERIRLRFKAADCEREFWISTVSPTLQGARILLAIPGRLMPEPLSLTWREPSGDGETPGENVKPALKWAGLKFPGCRIISAARHSDLAHSLSGAFLRIRLRHHNRDILLLVVPAHLNADEMPAALTQTLLWADHFGKQIRRLPLAHILVPSGGSDVVSHRSGHLDSSRIKLSIWEYVQDPGDQWQVRRARVPVPPVEHRDFRWPVLGPFRWSADLQRVLDLAPSSIRRYPRFQDYDSLRLWGLEFARVVGAGRDRVLFGAGSPLTELSDDNFSVLRSLVDEILYYRRADSPDTRHPLYRMQAESWLESLILDEVPRLFPELLPESVYPQIPVYLGKDPGRVDILGADRSGRLVVMELKVTTDPHMPLQALDYWGRVVHHNQNGDFEHRGYFSGIPLDRRPPKIYLVSPVFSFHDTTERQVSYFHPGIEIWKVSVNEDWRSGVKIMRRIQLRCGDLI